MSELLRNGRRGIYPPPVVEVIELEVERGFATSSSSGLDYNDDWNNPGFGNGSDENDFGSLY
ncbi:MAG: hypothetical protein K2J51_07055 [Alistipes sp.]|nr:hypothetical protein [Alistipes sp.]